jgi:carbonic anhydrase
LPESDFIKHGEKIIVTTLKPLLAKNRSRAVQRRRRNPDVALYAKET